MRLACLAFLACATAAFSQDAARYGVRPDRKSYPQATAKEALGSVLKAIDDRRFDYLTAQLADPAFIDDRVKRVYAGKFDEQVQDTQARLDPAAVKLLRRFAKDGTWTVGKATAVVGLEGVPERVVRLVKKGDLWFLAHDSSPER
ncbi:MAG: hypothetical protein U0797_02930 [Gemmataceae bacterium]